MKNLSILASVAVLSLAFTSCCSMFSWSSNGPRYRTETVEVATGDYDTVTEEVQTGGKGGMAQLVEKRVPRYKTVTRKVRIKSPGRCARFFCPKKTYCGTTSEEVMLSTSVQGSTGSVNMGLVPTMRPLAP